MFKECDITNIYAFMCVFNRINCILYYFIYIYLTHINFGKKYQHFLLQTKFNTTIIE